MFVSYRNISCKPKNSPGFSKLSFDVKSGHITMITGLAEDGLLTLENVITGMNTRRAGGDVVIDLRKGDGIADPLRSVPKVEVKDRPQSRNQGPSPKSELRTVPKVGRKVCRRVGVSRITPRLLRSRLGFTTAIIPTDRIYRGSSPLLTLRQLTGNSPLSTEDLINLAQINVTPDEKASELSGGMLQRFILHRELSLKPDCLILCHPLQGLDPEATEFICSEIRRVADEGCAVLVLSAGEFPAELCEERHRLYRGSFV